MQDIGRFPRRKATSTAAILACLTLATLASGSAQVPQLSFEERVRAQEAIERVYYRHQFGVTRPFEEVVPPAVLERKVRTYLKQSVALERLWKTPITEAALQRELERIAANTRFPERLEEIYEALKRDRSLVLECFTRPVLVDRLTRSFFAFNQRVHAAAREEANDLRERLARGSIEIHAEHPNRHVLQAIKGDRSKSAEGQIPTIGTRHVEDSSGRPLELEPEEFERWRARAPHRVGDLGPVVEERDAFVIIAVLDETSVGVRLAVYTVPKTSWESWWTGVEGEFDEASVSPVATSRGQPPVPGAAIASRSIEAGIDTATVGAGAAASTCVPDDTWDNGILDELPRPRYDHTAVWTGNLMIVWGGAGFDFEPQGTGARYDPLTDTWASTTTINAPAARAFQTAVWAGTEMIVWGGSGFSNSLLATGGRYDPVADSWEPTSMLRSPTGRYGHTAVWTGSEMIIWGGHRSMDESGGRYDPATDTWSAISTAGAPSPRSVHTAVWTGSQMIIWGGVDADTDATLDTGGRYDPVSDAWTATSTTGAPEGRFLHTAVWTGSRMIVWGGRRGSSDNLNTGGQYDPISDTWTTTSTFGAPSERNSHTAIWTGNEMIVWGGLESYIDFHLALQTGGRYDPSTDTWVPTTVYAPVSRARHSAVWTGSLMIVWGGHFHIGGFGLPEAVFNSGGRYDPASDTWTPTSRLNTPEGVRCCHTAVWTGNLMIVWGGRSEADFSVNTGARYDLLTDTWTPTSLTNAPAPRDSHQAVWTGSEMIVWGGSRNDGGRYDPVSDSWRSMSTARAPSSRFLRTPAIWTGREMIVWGGLLTTTTATDTGGRYDPERDHWRPTSTTNAPSPRTDQTAVWTGSEMIIWGGSTPLVGVHNTGARYDPVRDAWEPVSLSGAPSGRQLHSATWTGTLMIVWGGTTTGPTHLNSGGRYAPETDSWTATSTANAPIGRYLHTAVWTGSRMIVWGGSTSTGVGNTGGLYDPAIDGWTPTSTTNTPLGYGGSGHRAIWTGGFMIVWARSWGGRYAFGQSVDADGDGYDCARDCDDTNPSAWGYPQQVSSLELQSGTSASLTWPSQASLVGPGTLYDLASGALLLSGWLDFGSATCLQSSIATAYSDGRPDPQAGSGFWYLVRARNSCGLGTYGTSSRDGSIPPCP